MALQKTVEFKGITVTDAYHKIDWVKVYKNPSGTVLLWVHLHSMVNSTAEVFVETEWELEYNLASVDNALIQGYVFLKTLPEFTGAIDV